MLVADVSFLWSVTVIVAVLAGGVFLVEAVAGQFVDLGRQIFHSRTGCQLTRVIRQGCWLSCCFRGSFRGTSCRCSAWRRGLAACLSTK